MSDVLVLIIGCLVFENCSYFISFLFQSKKLVHNDTCAWWSSSWTNASSIEIRKCAWSSSGIESTRFSRGDIISFAKLTVYASNILRTKIIQTCNAFLMNGGSSCCSSFVTPLTIFHIPTRRFWRVLIFFFHKIGEWDFYHLQNMWLEMLRAFTSVQVDVTEASSTLAM